jgi:hypothetical protein
LEVQGGCVEPAEIEMTYDFWVETLQEFVLCVKVRFEKAFLCGGGEGVEASLKGGQVKVDRDLVDVVDGTDEVVYAIVVVVEDMLEVVKVEWGDVFGL